VADDAVQPRYEPVYRHINVLNGRQLFLGEPFPQDIHAKRVDDSTYALRPGTFGGGGTVAIVARVNADAVVRALLFIYDGSESFAEKVANYTESLGPPAETQSTHNGGEVRVWQDRQTRFELHSAPGEAREFWSVLLDLTGGSRSNKRMDAASAYAFRGRD